MQHGLAQDLFNKFMPQARPHFQYQQPNVVQYGYIPLYIIKGPDPMYDYMGQHFQARNMFKRFQMGRMKRQVENNGNFQNLLDSFGGELIGT